MWLIKIAGIALTALCLGDILLYEVTRIALDIPIAIIPTIGFLVFGYTDYTSAVAASLGFLIYVLSAAEGKHRELELTIAGIALTALCLGDILLYEVTRIALDTPISIIPTIGFLVFEHTDYTSAVGASLGFLIYVFSAAEGKHRKLAIAGIALTALCLGDILLYEVTDIVLDSPIAIIPTIRFLVFDYTDYTSATGGLLGSLTYVGVALWEKDKKIKQDIEHIELGTFLVEGEKCFYQEHASFRLKRWTSTVSDGALFMTDIRIFFVAVSEQDETNVTFFEAFAVVFQLALEDVKFVSMRGLTLLITDTNDNEYRFLGRRKKMLYGYEVLNGLIRSIPENTAGIDGE